MKRTLLVTAVVGLISASTVWTEVDRRDSELEPQLRFRQFWERLEYPDDSPYWWTLSDEVSPRELRSKIDRAQREAQLRVMEQLRLGQQPEAPVALLDGAEDPDVFPVWYALADFAGFYRADGIESVRRALKKAGLSASALELVSETVASWWISEQDLGELTGEAQRQLQSCGQQMRSSRGVELKAEIWRENDLARLASICGVEEAKLEQIARLASRDTMAEAMLPLLVELRESLSYRDWIALRAYLREYIKSHIVFAVPDLRSISSEASQ